MTFPLTRLPQAAHGLVSSSPLSRSHWRRPLVVIVTSIIVGSVHPLEKTSSWLASVRDTNRQEGCNGWLIASRFVLSSRRCLFEAHLLSSPSSVRVEVLGYPSDDEEGNHDFGVERIHSQQEIVLLRLNRSVPLESVELAVPHLGLSTQPNMEKGQKLTTNQMMGCESDMPPVAVKAKFLPAKRCNKRLSLDDQSLLGEIDGLACAIPKTTSNRIQHCQTSSALVVPGEGKWKGRSVIMAVQTFTFSACSPGANGTAPDISSRCPMAIFQLLQAADFLKSIVCQNKDHGHGDWCPETVQPKLIQNLRKDGHTGNIYWVAFNSNGSRLVSSSCDGSVRLWNPLEGGRPLATWTVPSGCLYSPVFHPQMDVALVASGSSNDDAIQLWHDSAVTVLSGHKSKVVSVAWHPTDANILASGSWDDTVRIWNTEKGRETELLTLGHKHNVNAISFHPQGMQLASASSDATVRLWNGSVSWELLFLLEGHSNVVTTVAYSPDGAWLASGSRDGSVRVWWTERGELFRVWTGDEEEVWSVAWHPQGRHVVAGSYDGTVRIWDTTTRSSFLPVAAWKAHSKSARSVAWSPDGKHIASGSWDESLKIWEIGGL